VEYTIVPPITVFWRPGCPFCASLFRDLERAGVAFAALNIWDDEEAAAFVRSVVDGNETVPAVTVGDLVFVNPPASRVLAAAAE